MTEEEKQDVLDELIHEIFSGRASQVNNDGMEAQRIFLLSEGFSQEELKELLGE